MNPSPPSPDEMIEAVRSALSLREHWLAMNAPRSTLWLENKARADALRAVLAQLEASRWRIDGQTIVEAARGLVRQIANNDFRDSHGHDATRLREYAVLQRFVSLAAPPATASEGGK